MPEYNDNDKINCPHCGEEQEYPAHEYAVANSDISGIHAVEECHECYKYFDAILIDADTVKITKGD